jgi:hypothetical protein
MIEIQAQRGMANQTQRAANGGGGGTVTKQEIAFGLVVLDTDYLSAMIELIGIKVGELI